jgi:SurA N-terminal domain
MIRGRLQSIGVLLALLAPAPLAAQDTTGLGAPTDTLVPDIRPVVPVGPVPGDTMPAAGKAPASDSTPGPRDTTLVPRDTTRLRPDSINRTPAESAPPPAGASSHARLPDSTVVVDRVVAVVGNRPVLASQVDEEMFSRQGQGQQLPQDPDSLNALRKQVVSSIVDEELLVQQAQRDTSIKVTDQEIADGVEQQVQKVRANFSSEVDYKNELRKAGFETP